MPDAAARFDVTTIGETMLRLSVPTGHRLMDSSAFEVAPGGAESNVCAALAGLERRCGWVSQLPDNALGELILRRLRAFGIDVSAAKRTNAYRLGTYYIEFADAPRATQVIYDRADSAASHLTPQDIDWSYLLDSRIIHLTGITPALSDSSYALTKSIVEKARSASCLVSFDVNFRQRLWSEDKARTLLKPLIRDVDVLMCSVRDAESVFGVTGSPEQVLLGLRDLTNARYIVMTVGATGVLGLDGERVLKQAAVPVQIVDRVGAGDAMSAGILDGLLDGSLAEGLKRGTALAALALSQYGDMVMTNRKELASILQERRADIVR